MSAHGRPEALIPERGSAEGSPMDADGRPGARSAEGSPMTAHGRSDALVQQRAVRRVFQ